MRVDTIDIANVKGIESLKIRAGAVTVISGDNGSGKSSVLTALQCLFEKGHDASIIRRGASEARVILTLDNGTVITHAVTEKESKTKITTADGSVVPKPRSFVEQLASGFSLDPTALIQAPTKERAKFLLEAMPISFTRDEISSLVEGTVAVNEDKDLAGFEALLLGREDERTGVNRVKRDIEGMRKSLASQLPPEEETDWNARTDTLQAELEDRRAELRELLSAFAQDAETLKESAREQGRQQVEAIRARMQAEIDDVNERVAREVEVVESAAKSNASEKRQPIDADIDRLNAELAVAKERSQSQLKANGAREEIAKVDANMRVYVEKSLQLDRIIDRLRALKKRKLEALPIDGVEVRDGKIFWNGLDFDTQINTAEQYKLSFLLATLKLGQLPIMVCDRAESLNEENFRMLCDAVRECGYQLIITSVKTGEPLKVTAA